MESPHIADEHAYFNAAVKVPSPQPNNVYNHRQTNALGPSYQRNLLDCSYDCHQSQQNPPSATHISAQHAHRSTHSVVYYVCMHTPVFARVRRCAREQVASKKHCLTSLGCAVCAPRLVPLQLREEFDVGAILAKADIVPSTSVTYTLQQVGHIRTHSHTSASHSHTFAHIRAHSHTFAHIRITLYYGGAMRHLPRPPGGYSACE
eukprot:1988032-Pyramimonas_sp.AAC.2